MQSSTQVLPDIRNFPTGQEVQLVVVVKQVAQEESQAEHVVPD
jgi:hypothetical protein